MAILTANGAGVIAGKFLIPSNIPAGTKRVVATGAGGTTADATFTGRGTVRTEQRRRLFRLERRVDPLAQTFTLSEGRHIAGVDLWFTAAGSDTVVVQIRDTELGMPGQDVIAEARVAPGSIAVSGASTRVLLPAPIWLDGGREFALVVLTDGPTAALAVAELGKFDASANRWITAQAYQVGVLLSSSNASTWTPHQDKDLAFRLLACKFTTATKSVPLGTVSAAGLTDLLALASIDVLATGADGHIKATTATGEVHKLVPGVPLSLPAALSGSLTLSAELAGSDKVSPVIYPSLQHAGGVLATTATYVTRAFNVGSSARVAVTFEALTPGTSTVVVEIQKSDTTWQTLAVESASEVGDGWTERVHATTGFTATTTRVRITLNGSAQYRPAIRKLRAVATG